MRRVADIIFSILFVAVLFLPLWFSDKGGGDVSTGENRLLAGAPSLFADGRLNEEFTGQFDAWFKDNMGFREFFVRQNAKLNYILFRKLSTDNYYLGERGDLIYLSKDMLHDYLHLNLRTDEEVREIGESYQTVGDWFAARGIQFYYVQCYDKHTIYPEQMMDTIKPLNTESKTDQVITYLQDNTSVCVISMKDMLLQKKAEGYEVYSNWGDPTHWTHRGAFFGYQYIMEVLNQHNDNRFLVMEAGEQEDYTVGYNDGGVTLNGVLHQADELEYFAVADVDAERGDASALGSWKEDRRHSTWENDAAGNRIHLLIIGDSYIDYIVDDLAESFYRVDLIWGDYTPELDAIVEELGPDIVLYECAERVDRSATVIALARKLKEE